MIRLWLDGSTSEPLGMGSDTWEGRMAQRAAERRLAADTEDYIKHIAELPEPAEGDRPYNYDPALPDDGTCRECFEWRQFPPGQEHFGYAWWHVCNWHDCDHSHHDDEVWIG